MQCLLFFCIKLHNSQIQIMPQGQLFNDTSGCSVVFADSKWSLRLFIAIFGFLTLNGQCK